MRRQQLLQRQRQQIPHRHQCLVRPSPRSAPTPFCTNNLQVLKVLHFTLGGLHEAFSTTNPQLRKYIFASVPELWLRLFIKRFYDNGSNRATTTTMLRQNWKSFTIAITGKSLIMTPSTIRRVVVMFLCTQNLFIGSRNVKEFNHINVVLKFGVSDWTMFNVHTTNLVHRNCLIVMNHMITWNTIMKNTVN